MNKKNKINSIFYKVRKKWFLCLQLFLDQRSNLWNTKNVIIKLSKLLYIKIKNKDKHTFFKFKVYHD